MPSPAVQVETSRVRDEKFDHPQIRVATRPTLQEFLEILFFISLLMPDFLPQAWPIGLGQAFEKCAKPFGINDNYQNRTAIRITLA